jgi:general secretion pathway protein N
MSALRLVAVFAALLALALVAMLPLGVALRAAGIDGTAITAVAARGSVWSGRLDAVSLGGVPVGDIDVGVQPLRLLTGVVAFRFAGTAADAPRGSVELSPSRRAIRGAHAKLRLGDSGATLSLDGVDAAFAKRACASAAGAASAEFALPDGSIVRLSGTPHCDGEQLLLPLAGATAFGAARFQLRIGGSGDYAYVLSLSADDPALAQGLAGAGFVSGDGEWVRRGAGRL